MNLPQKVLFVIPKQSSFSAFLKELSETLVNRDVEVHCACAIAPQLLRNSAVHFHNIPFARGMDPIRHFRAARQLSGLVQEICPDLIHAHFSSTIFTTALAIKSNWPITIGTFQGLGYPLIHKGIKRYLLRQAESWAATRLHGVWVLTQDDFQQLKADLPSGNIHLQSSPGFGCRIQYFSPDLVPDELSEALRLELGIGLDERVYTYIGRFTNFKGFALVVQTFFDFYRTYPKTKLLLIGQQDLVHSSGLTQSDMDQLKSHPGILDVGWQDDVRKYLAISDVVVFPSEREGVPVSLMEATAMGVPVITTNVRGCRDVIVDQSNGLVLSERSHAALMQAMVNIQVNEYFRSALKAGALMVRERFDRSHYIQEQIEIYGRYAHR